LGGTIDSIIATLRGRGSIPLACYRPRFIVEQMLAACKLAGIPAQCKPDLAMALANLSTREESGDATLSRALKSNCLTRGRVSPSTIEAALYGLRPPY
jgi:hypothetical protein